MKLTSCVIKRNKGNNNTFQTFKNYRIPEKNLTFFFFSPSGVTILVPQENNFLDKNLAIGEVVTFSYENVTQKNIPLDPKICRVRHDILWEDVEQKCMLRKEERGREREGRIRVEDKFFFFN
jgi:hypothetical protein